MLLCSFARRAMPMSRQSTTWSPNWALARACSVDGEH
jgi:hypothetical protein